MKIVYNDILKKGIEEFLLSQDGINKVVVGLDNDMNYIEIDYSNDTTPSIINNYIDLYQDSNYSTMISFDKELNGKIINYKVEDMCCEFCHMRFINELFDYDNVIAVTSDFSYDKPAFNITYKIEVKEDEEDEIIEQIENTLKKIGLKK